MSILDLLSDDPYPLVLPFRFAQIVGRYGGGKTALTVHWARRLAIDGHIAYICANIPLSLPVVSEHAGRPRDLRYTCYIMDEGWQYLSLDASARQLKAELAYLRKLGNYILTSSVIPLTRHVASFPTIEFVFSFSRVLGIHWWIYRWSVGGRGRTGRHGYWWWMTPTSTWGLYDSSYIPSDIWWIYDITEWRGQSLTDWAAARGIQEDQLIPCGG